MIYTRVKLYTKDNVFTTCEHLYSGTDTNNAILRFHKEYPSAHKGILKTEFIDNEDPKHKEYFSICRLCGCVD